MSGGVETKADAKGVLPTKLLDLQNATFIKATTLAKRNGYRALGQHDDQTVAIVAGTRGLGERDGELVEFTDDNCYSYRPSSNNWSNAGEVSSVVYTDVPVARTGTAQTIPDIADNQGVRAVAWEDSRGGVWCSVVEAATGRILLAQTQLDATGISPRCVAAGTVLLVLYAIKASGRIMVAVINPANAGTVPVATILTDDLSKTNAAYDAEPSSFDTSAPAVIAWARNGGGYRVGFATGAGTLGSPLTGLPSVDTEVDVFDGPIAVSYSTSYVAVDWGDSNAGTNVAFHTTSTLARFASSVVSATKPGTGWARITGAFDANGVYWWANESQEQSDSSLNLIIAGRTALGGSHLGTTNISTLQGHGLISRAFADNGQIYVCIAHGVTFFPYAAAIKLSATNGIAGGNTVCVARMLPGSSTGLGLRRLGAGSFEVIHHVSSVLTTLRKHVVPIGIRLQLQGVNGDQFGEQGIRVATLDFNHSGAYQTAQLGRNLYLAGAVPTSYDGDKWTEADFHCAPDTGTNQATGAAMPIAGSAAGGGSMLAGTYGYKFWYESVDDQGELHPGAVSVQVNVTVVDNQKVTFNIPTCRMTNRRAVRICVARSPVNQTGDPESIPFFRVSGLDPNVQSGNNRFVLNDPTQATIIFTDAISDATLLTKEPLYTNGGILSNDPSPMAGGVLAGGKSRLYWTDPSDPNLVRFSQELRDDTAAETPVLTSLRVDPFGGDITGIGTIDGTTVVFKESCLFSFGGPGPDADGGLTSQNAFSPPQLLTSDVGCIAPASIASTPVGITFQSAKGIKMLGRDGQVIDIGAAVYAYKDQTITRATLLPDRHQVVFLTNAGRTLLFDYEHQQWSTYTNHEGLDAVVVDGVYYYLRTDGRVFQETPGLYVDDNSHIKMVIETAWIKMAGELQAWQKVLWAYFLGTYKSSHTLRCRYRIDYQDGYSAPKDIPVDGDYNPHVYGAGSYGVGPYGGALDAGTVYQQRWHLNKRCQSISFRIEDVEADGVFGAAFELSELKLIGGVLGPSMQVGAGRSQ